MVKDDIKSPRNAKLHNYFYSFSKIHSNNPWIISEPIKTEIARLPDFIGSPVQNQEHNNTHKKVTALMRSDFFENV